MTRETKAGLVVSCSFLCLVGTVLFCKLTERDVSAADGGPASNEQEAKATAPAEPKPVTTEPPTKPGSHLASVSGVVQTGSLTTEDGKELSHLTPPPKQGSSTVPTSRPKTGAESVLAPTKPASKPAVAKDETGPPDLLDGLSVPEKQPSTDIMGPEKPSTGVAAPVPVATTAPPQAPVASTSGPTASPTTKEPSRALSPVPAPKLTENPKPAPHAQAVAQEKAPSLDKSTTSEEHGRPTQVPPARSVADLGPLPPPPPPATNIGTQGSPLSPSRASSSPIPPRPDFSLNQTPDKPNTKPATAPTSSPGTGPLAGPLTAPTPPAPNPSTELAFNGSPVLAANGSQPSDPALRLGPPAEPRAPLAPTRDLETRPLPPLGTPVTAATAPIQAPSLPAPRAADAAPQVESYDEEAYTCRAADNFSTISQTYYHSDRFARALLLFNRNHPLATDAVKQEPPVIQQGLTVYIPPQRILERYYGMAIASEAPPAPPKTYRVGSNGEMFLEIARRTLKDENRWAEIYRLNSSFDPSVPVPAGTELRLPPDAQVQ